jgi:hypothetical protein
MEAFQSRKLDLPNFYFTGDDYRYRFEFEAKTRFITLLRERFNSGANYDGRILKWDTVIEQKVAELGRFLTGKTSALDFEEPSPELACYDDRQLRCRILTLSQSEAKEVGIGKSTLHYLRKRAQEQGYLNGYRKTLARLQLARSE